MARKITAQMTMNRIRGARLAGDRTAERRYVGQAVRARTVRFTIAKVKRAKASGRSDG